jgi:hypothetical protein
MLPERSASVSHRTFLQRAAATGLAAGGAMAAPRWLTPAARAAAPRAGLNLLLMMVAPMRTPWVYLLCRLQAATIPTLTRIAGEGVRFSTSPRPATAGGRARPRPPGQSTALADWFSHRHTDLRAMPTN